MLKYGADVEVKDDNAFTPLFHAAKHGSVTNLLELFETGKAKPNHIAKDEKGIQKTALCLAKCTETVKILLNFGVKTCNILQPEKSMNTNTMADVTNLAEFLENHSEESSNIILNECLEEINEDLVVFNFEPFEDVSMESNEMELHRNVQKNKKSGLLLHPIMQAFLYLKWKQVKKLYFLFMCFEVAFVIALSFLGYDFVRMTFCNYCGEKYLRNEPTDLFHPHKFWDQKYGENVPPYHKNEDSLGQLSCFVKSEDDCDNDDNPGDCNGESLDFRRSITTDFCDDIQTETTEQGDCALIKFKGNKSQQLQSLKDDYFLSCHKHFLR